MMHGFTLFPNMGIEQLLETTFNSELIQQVTLNDYVAFKHFKSFKPYLLLL
jgi:hypothetical protein